MFTPKPHSIVNQIRFFVTRKVSAILKLFGYQQQQLIICGYPRSGTSLLYNMMSTTLKTNFEFLEFEKYFMYTLHKMGNIASKAPLDINHIEYLDSLNIHRKRLVFIVVIRDIRDILISRHPNNPEMFFIGYDHSFWHNYDAIDSWSYVAPGIIDISKKVRLAQLKPYTFTVKYEDLVSDPDDVQRQLEVFSNYTFELAFSQYHTKQDKMAYRYSGRYEAKDKSLVLEGTKVQSRVAKWKDPKYRERIIEQFTCCPELLDLLIEYGYEDNKDWFSELLDADNSLLKNGMNTLDKVDE